MSDIVERLRSLACKADYDEYGVHSDTELEAATEIEKLRVVLDKAADALHDAGCYEAWAAARAVLGEKE
jgi:hypothetical protein